MALISQATTRRMLPTILLILILMTAANAQTRAELCAKYAVDATTYNCCMNGIEDWDQCYGQAGGGQVQEAPVQHVHIIRPTVYESGGHQFTTQLGKTAYESLASCNKARLSKCPAFDAIFQPAFQKHMAYVAACGDNQRCKANAPKEIFDILQAGKYANEDFPLPKAQTQVQKAPVQPAKTLSTTTQTASTTPTKPATPPKPQPAPTIQERYVDMEGKSVQSVRQPVNNPATGTMSYIRTVSTYPDLKKGDVLKFSLEGSYLGEGMLVVGEDTKAGSLEVQSVRNPRGSPPQGMETAFKALQTLSTDTDVLEVYRLSNGPNQKDPFQESLLKWNIQEDKSQPILGYRMKHYAPDGWRNLPQMLDFCGQLICTYISDPQGLGIYALVAEKPPVRHNDWYFSIASILGILIAFGSAGYRFWKAKRDAL